MLLLGSQAQRHQLGVDVLAVNRRFVAAAAVVELDDLLERCNRPVVHVGRGLRDLAQAHHAESADVAAVARIEEPAFVSSGRTRSAGVGRGRRPARSDLLNPLYAKARIRKQRPAVAVDATGLVVEEHQPALLRERQGLVVARHIAIVRGVDRVLLALKRGDGPAEGRARDDRLQGRRVVDATEARQLPGHRIGFGRKGLLKQGHVFGDRPQPRQHAVHGHLALVGVAAQLDAHDDRPQGLGLQAAVLAVPQHEALGRGLPGLVAIVADVEDGHGVPRFRNHGIAGDRRIPQHPSRPQALARRAGPELSPVGHAQGRQVTRATGRVLLAAEDGVEKQEATQLDAVGIVGVVGGIGQRRQRLKAQALPQVVFLPRCAHGTGEDDQHGCEGC